MRSRMRKSVDAFLAMWFALCGVSLARGAEPAVAEVEALDELSAVEPSTFLRISENDDGEPTALETAIVRYRATDAAREGLIVDLIGAVHVGEADYYAELNRRFKKYDVLLYELVAPEGTRVPKGGRGGSTHPVGMMQDGLKELLGLEHQLNHVNYQKKNFVHADMSPDEFSQRMSERGESFLGMYFRMMGHGIAQQTKDGGGATELNLLMALFSKNRSLALKRALAVQFEDLDGAMDAFEGEEGSTIISERNKKALEVLNQQILEGKKRIGIFYGAGHMIDMEERLVKVYGLVPTKQSWLTAWNLTDVAPPAAPAKKTKAAANE